VCRLGGFCAPLLIKELTNFDLIWNQRSNMLTPQEKRTAIIRILIVAFVLFFNSASTMYLYSFLPQMMVDFRMASTSTESGIYASWMASGYFFGRFLTAPAWGNFLDKQGRKKALLAILGSVSLLTIAFGLTKSYWFALAVRIFSGFFNGLSVVGKVLTTEVCPEELKSWSISIWSISIISTIWSLGMTCGPFIGSLFYDMIPGWPYLAPALAVALMGFTLMILSYFFIDETLKAPELPPPKKELELPVRNSSENEESTLDNTENSLSESAKSPTETSPDKLNSEEA
jgi:MFS family permease